MSNLVLIYTNNKEDRETKELTDFCEATAVTYLCKVVGKDITKTDYDLLLQAMNVDNSSGFPQVILIGEDTLASYVGSGETALHKLKESM